MIKQRGVDQWLSTPATSILPSSKKNNLVTGSYIFYSSNINLDIHISRFIVLEYIISSPRFVFLTVEVLASTYSIHLKINCYNTTISIYYNTTNLDFYLDS